MSTDESTCMDLNEILTELGVSRVKTKRITEGVHSEESDIKSVLDSFL